MPQLAAELAPMGTRVAPGKLPGRLELGKLIQQHPEGDGLRAALRTHAMAEGRQITNPSWPASRAYFSDRRLFVFPVEPRRAADRRPGPESAETGPAPLSSGASQSGRRC